MPIPLQQYRSLLAGYLKPQQGRVIGLAIALLSGIALQIINPQILAYFIDTAVKGGDQQALLIPALGFTAIALLTQIFSVLTTYLGETVAWIATNALRLDLASHCLHLDLSFHKCHTPGALLERVDGDVNLLARFFSQLIIHILGNAILLVGILAVLWFENRLAGLSLTIFALVALSLLLGLRLAAIAPYAEYLQVSAEFYGRLVEHIGGREDLRANGAVAYVMDRFHQILQRWLPVYQKARLASTILWSTSVGLFTVGNGIALTMAAYLWNQDQITIGTAYLIFHYTNLLAQPIEQIREELEQLPQVEASIYRIRELFRIESQLIPPVEVALRQALGTGALGVEFEQVWFYYPSAESGDPVSAKASLSPNWTLQNLSFQLEPGQVLGILGRTGSGKSTIARLLLRLYDRQSGQICLGGCPIAHIPFTELRQRVGLVTQDVQLFQATVRDNLTFFDPRIRDTDLLETLEGLGLIDWLQSLPQGLNTCLGANSAGLSAGQAQILAFVRVFLKNPGLVILDEASSRLDPQTEVLIEQAIARLLQGRTGIIIAHRLQTVQRADQILILDRGRIVEYGDRLTLTRQDQSRYAQLLRTRSMFNDGLQT